MTKTQYDIIILSPHLDDAVASLGGLMSKKISEGKKVHVVNIYTKSIERTIVPKKFWKLDIYDERKAEDKIALDYLGATIENAEFYERVMREPWLKSVLGVFHTPDDLDAYGELKNIQKFIIRLLKENPNAKIYAPLGSGNHFDHIEVFLAAFLLMFEKDYFDRIVFYEDLYSAGTIMRKRHFLTKTKLWNFRKAPARLNLQMNIMLFVMGMSARGKKIEDLIGAELSEVTWQHKTEKIPEDHFQRKVDALYKYPSQANAFGNKRTRGERLLRRYHNFWGGGEPIWTVKEKN